MRDLIAGPRASRRGAWHTGWWCLTLLLLSARAAAQGPPTVRVSGTISAADTRQPVGGATVQVQSRNTGRAANAVGEFVIDAQPTDTLLFRAVGYRPQRLPLGGASLSQLVVQIRLVRDSVRLPEVRVSSDRPDRAVINRALRNIRRPVPPPVSQVKRPPKPKPLFPVDSSAPKPPTPTLENPVSLIYEQFSRAGKERRKMAEIQEAEKAEQARKARQKYNRAFRDNRGYE